MAAVMASIMIGVVTPATVVRPILRAVIYAIGRPITLAVYRTIIVIIIVTIVDVDVAPLNATGIPRTESDPADAYAESSCLGRFGAKENHNPRCDGYDRQICILQVRHDPPAFLYLGALIVSSCLYVGGRINRKVTGIFFMTFFYAKISPSISFHATMVYESASVRSW